MGIPEHATAEQIANTMALIEEAYRIRRGTHKKPFDGFTEMRHREAYRKCIFRLSEATKHNQEAQISALAMARQVLEARQKDGKRVKKNTEIKQGMWVIFSTDTTAREDWWKYNLYQRTPEEFNCHEIVNHTPDNEDTTEEDEWFESDNIQQDIALEWLKRENLKRPATPSGSIGNSPQSPNNRHERIRPTSKNDDVNQTIIAAGTGPKEQRHITENRNRLLLFLAVLAAAALAVILVFGFPVLTPITGLSLAAWKALCVISFAAVPIGCRLFAYAMATPSHQMPGRQIGRVALTVLSVILSTAFLIFAIPMLLAPLGAKAALATYTHLQHVAIGAGMIDAVLATGAGVMLYAIGKHEKGYEEEPIHRNKTDSTAGGAAIPESDRPTTVGGFHDGCNPQTQEDSNDDPFDSERLPEPLI